MAGMHSSLPPLNVLPCFQALHPSVIWYCNLCSKVIAEDEYVTVEARRARATRGSGEYIFCQQCSPHLDELTKRLGAEGARMDADHEKAKKARLETLAKELLAELKSRYSRGPGTNPPPRADGSTSPSPSSALRRAPGSMIPIPGCRIPPCPS